MEFDGLEIIFEDENFLAVNKPSGLVVHGDGRTEEKSLVEWIEINFPELEEVGNPHTLDSGRYSKRWGVINRLDRDTSGLILIAKNEEVFKDLQKQFLERTIVKEYVAKVWGRVAEKSEIGGKITEPISRHKKDPRIWVCGTGVGERQTKRDAETDFEIINRGGNSDKEVPVVTTLLRLFPKTGRTHQLRLHCRFIGHPIVGDIKYGINGITNEHGTQQIEKVLGGLDSDLIDQDKNSRLMLHAKSLVLIHPVTKEKIKIETELPKKFIDF